MIDVYLNQLQSPDVEERRSAIVALAKAQDPAALPALGRIYKEDPVPELRELALKAGRYIKQSQEQAPPGAPPPPPPPRTASQLRALSTRSNSQSGDVPARTGSQTMPPRTPSKQEEARAHNYLDTALNYYSAGDRPRAVESLGRAFELNPLIHKEVVASNLAQTLTGLSHAEAIDLLADPYRRKAFAASLPGMEGAYGRGKAKRGASKSQKMVTWVDLLLDLALFWLVVSIALTAVFGFGIKTLVNEYGDQVIEASARNPTPYTQDDLDTLANASVLVWLFASMTIAVSWAIFLMINGLAIHLAATMGMAGKNSYVDFMHRFIPFVTVVALIYGAVSALTILLIPSAPGIAGLLWTMMGVGVIVSLFVMAWLIGSVYQFGIIYGFATMILSVVVSCILGCLLNFALSTLLSGSNSAIYLLAR